MGGFGSAIGDAAEQLGKTVAEHLGAVSHVFEHTDEGRMLLNDARNIYQPIVKQSVETLTKQHLATAKADPLKPQINIGEIHTQAAKVGREAWLGPKDSFGATLVASVEKKHGTAAAQSLSNGIAFILKDFHDPLAHREGEVAEEAVAKGRGMAQAPFSSFKKNMVKAGVNLSSVEPSYTPPGATSNTLGKYERPVTSAIYQTFSPLMVVPHIATIVNGMFGSDPITFLKGISEPIAKSLSGTSLDTQISDFDKLVTTGAFTEHYTRAVKEWNQFEATGHPQFTGSGIARVVYNMFHQPGFAKWRDYNLLSGANVGKMTAEQLGRDLAKKGPTPRLQWQASQFGLDAGKLIKNGGKLDEEDLSRAVFKFVNEHYFLDNSLHRSQLLQSNWVGRLLGTYHGYVTRQSKLMGNAMFRNFRERGAASVVKNLAVGATIMPLFGEAIKLTQQGYRGQPAEDTFNTDLANLQGKHGATKAAETYFEAMSHSGAYGVYGHVMRGTLTHSIIQSLSGPMLSSAADFVQDTGTAVGKDIKTKGHQMLKNSRAQARDLMFDTPGISLLAQFLAHRVLPNSRDNVRHDPARQLYHHLRGEDSLGNPIEEKEK